MKRSVLAALVALACASAGSAEETQRYLVATKLSFRAGALGAILRDARQGVSPRNVAGFEALDGFAADLTSSEVAELQRNPNVRWVEPVIERHAFARTARNLNSQTVPYGVDAVHAREAWIATRTATINVVVIDTGVDYRHEELKSVWAGGYNFVAGTEDPLDDAAHGTHVAGTIAAANNDTGVVGVAPDIRLWGLKVLDSAGSGSSESVIKAVDWIIAKKNAAGGNWVANLSLGSSSSSALEREAFARGVAAGILFCAATGNDSTPADIHPVSFPAAYPDVIGVGAVDDLLALGVFSNQGPEVDVVAPGVDVLSTLPVGSGSIARIQAQQTTYEAAAILGSKRGHVTGQYVYCGLGKPEEIPASVAGKIALIKRGDLRFSEKTRNAKDAGAIAVVIFNNDASAINWRLVNADEPWGQTYDWPVAIGIAKADGEALRTAGSGTITLVNDPDDYGYNTGTSMATPHVAAAAALVWSAAAHATAADVAAALKATARDLGASGQDNAYGAGVINILEAIKRLAPSAIDPMNPPPGSRPVNGRRILRRG